MIPLFHIVSLKKRIETLNFYLNIKSKFWLNVSAPNVLILDLKRNGMTLNLISVRIHILPILDSEEIYLNLIEIKFTCLIIPTTPV